MGTLKIRDGKIVVSQPFSPGEEQEFKVEMIRKREIMSVGSTAIFEVENEEKEPGFPDTLEVNRLTFKSTFIEYKVSDADGIIEFEKSQPLFYRRNAQLLIYVCAYCVPDGTFYTFTAHKMLLAMMDRFERGEKGLKVSVKGGVLS